MVGPSSLLTLFVTLKLARDGSFWLGSFERDSGSFEEDDFKGKIGDHLDFFCDKELSNQI